MKIINRGVQLKRTGTSDYCVSWRKSSEKIISYVLASGESYHRPKDRSARQKGVRQERRGGVSNVNVIGICLNFTAELRANRLLNDDGIWRIEYYNKNTGKSDKSHDSPV